MPWSIAPRWAAARSGTVVGIPSYIILSCIVVFAVAAARLVPSIAFHGDWASVIFNSALRPDVLDHSKTPSADFVSRLPIGLLRDNDIRAGPESTQVEGRGDCSSVQTWMPHFAIRWSSDSRKRKASEGGN
jgi:hypothetical protein